MTRYYPVTRGECFKTKIPIDLYCGPHGLIFLAQDETYLAYENSIRCTILPPFRFKITEIYDLECYPPILDVIITPLDDIPFSQIINYRQEIGSSFSSQWFPGVGQWFPGVGQWFPGVGQWCPMDISLANNKYYYHLLDQSTQQQFKLRDRFANARTIGLFKYHQRPKANEFELIAEVKTKLIKSKPTEPIKQETVSSRPNIQRNTTIQRNTNIQRTNLFSYLFSP